MAQPTPQANVVTRVSINATPEEVFKYLSNTRCHKLWVPSLEKIQPLAKLRLGSHYQTDNLVFGVRTHSDIEVTKFVLDKELEIKNNSGIIKYLINYRLGPRGGRTTLTCRRVVSAEGRAFAFTRPVLATFARRQIQADLQSLKIVVEQGIKPE